MFNLQHRSRRSVKNHSIVFGECIHRTQKCHRFSKEIISKGENALHVLGLWERIIECGWDVCVPRGSLGGFGISFLEDVNY